MDVLEFELDSIFPCQRYATVPYGVISASTEIVRRARKYKYVLVSAVATPGQDAGIAHHEPAGAPYESGDKAASDGLQYSYSDAISNPWRLMFESQGVCTFFERGGWLLGWYQVNTDLSSDVELQVKMSLLQIL